jgi:transposase
VCCNRFVPTTADSLPDDVATLKAMVIVAQAARLEAEAKARNMEAEVRAREQLIEQMKFTIKKLRHEQLGQSSERHAMLEQLELSLAEMKEDASQAEAAAQIAVNAAATANIKVPAFERRRPARRPSAHAVGNSAQAGEGHHRDIGSNPAAGNVIQHVHQKFPCRSCEAITLPSAPSHPIVRGRAGPGLLAHILFCKYGLHLPLNRQSATHAREGVDLDVSTLVGATAATLMPLILLIQTHVFAAERIHADDTTVRVLAKGPCHRDRPGRTISTQDKVRLPGSACVPSANHSNTQ